MKIIRDLSEQLVLTARHTQYDIRAPGNRVYKRVIGGGITGVECDDHISFFSVYIGAAAFIIGDVPAKEFQSFISQIGSDAVTVVYNILFQVKTCDTDLFSPDCRHIVIYGKRQISFAASEVYYPYRSASLVYGGENIVNYFKVAVYLTEFTVPAGENMTVFVHDAEPDKKIHGLSVRYNIILLPVV